MASITQYIQFAIIGLAAAWLVAIALRPKRTPLHWSWAAFCASMFTVGVSGAFGSQLGGFELAMQAGGSAGCGTAWLFTRALFRERRAIEWPHIALVLAIMAPSIFVRILWGFDAGAVIGEARLNAIVEGAFGAQTLLSSTILVLSFVEVFRDWNAPLTRDERVLRLAYGGAFASSVLICVAWANYTVEPVRVLVTSSCALMLVVMGGLALRHRMRRPVTARDPAALSAEDADFAARIDRLVRAEALYLSAEIKVADLAARLQEPEYKVSRAIALALGSANFSQYINRFRIEHASRLLADPAQARTPILNIALDSGFASPGPFNRAFKAAHGVTPREYRVGAMNGAPDALPAE